AISAINSYTLLDIIDEILDEKPDAILVYAGHNEFYGALGIASAESLGKFRWFIKAYLKLKRYKTFCLIADIIGIFRSGISKNESKNQPTTTMMEQIVAGEKIAYGSDIYELGKQQFKKNLSDILKKLNKANVLVLISELVSNIKDQKPFVSIEENRLPSADALYQRARELEREQKFDKAKTIYYRAKDLDALRFRATEEFNEIIHELASKYNVSVVPMKSYFESISANGLIGDNLMVDHLHPNIEGCFLMAKAFFETMQENGFVTSRWDSSYIKPDSCYRHSWGITPLDSVYSDLRIRSLKGGWPFKPKSAPNLMLQNFQPKTKIEYLALRSWLDRKFTLEDAHIDLVENYEKSENFQLAYEECIALSCLKPYNVKTYLKAADMLIKQGKFTKALDILYYSLKIEETAFAFKWIGHILLIQNNIEESIFYLEKVYKMVATDSQVLYDLIRVYIRSKQYKMAKEIFIKLYELDPEFPGLSDLKL
ncbi:MAG: hypothetical protein JSW07_15090, partial [bacterium]